MWIAEDDFYYLIQSIYIIMLYITLIIIVNVMLLF
jgi:hypothetical protein